MFPALPFTNEDVNLVNTLADSLADIIAQQQDARGFSPPHLADAERKARDLAIRLSAVANPRPDIIPEVRAAANEALQIALQQEREIAHTLAARVGSLKDEVRAIATQRDNAARSAPLADKEATLMLAWIDTYDWSAVRWYLSPEQRKELGGLRPAIRKGMDETMPKVPA